MIVRAEIDGTGHDFFIPQEWRATVVSLLQNIDNWVIQGHGKIIQPRLVAVGLKKIAVIRVIREHYGFALKLAKELVDRAPCQLPGLPHTTASRMVMDLEKEGASVELPSAVEQLGALAKNENAARAALAALNGGEIR